MTGRAIYLTRSEIRLHRVVYSTGISGAVCQGFQTVAPGPLPMGRLIYVLSQMLDHIALYNLFYLNEKVLF
jgi:hypothetical protein